MDIIIELTYLISSILFIFGIKKLSSPKTARLGNFYSAFGMLLAILATLLYKSIITYEWIIIGFVTGSLIGYLMAVKVQMTGMPQMVGLLNGFGGGASLLVALAEYYKLLDKLGSKSGEVLQFSVASTISIELSLIIGAVTFTGSLIAFGKLQGIVTGKVVKFPLQQPLNILIFLTIVGLSIYAVMFPEQAELAILAITGLSLILGVLLVLPIGGADMPVAISLLNSYSGLAAATTGFVLRNNELIITGALVGASGIILTLIMCKGMNRSLMNVLLGGWSAAGTTSADSSGSAPKGDIKSVDSEEAAIIFDSASSVIIVPGYGMAVAQAQHAIRDLVNVLEKKNIKVRFAIHPVAGRMPGHMNVLLAEAQIPYDKLYALEDINDDFNNTDVVLIIGANDVVNPAARHDKNSPIYGMPILNVDYAKTVIMNKRSMNPGYAGIENELFYYPNTLMYFGDAKDAITKLTNELKNL
jgi:NAD(P) transhydrogenase subunit beta